VLVNLVYEVDVADGSDVDMFKSPTASAILERKS
jgi:hypothetical protein